MRFCIEYKPREPRNRMVFSSCARTLLAIEEMGCDNVGILLDFGHSLYGGESPAEAAKLALSRDRLFAIDVNDNFRGWDDDMVVGSVHLLETFEFFHALHTAGWEGVWQLDQFPFREDSVQAAKDGIETMRGFHRALLRLDHEALREAQDAQDALLAQRIVKKALYSAMAELDGGAGMTVVDSATVTVPALRADEPAAAAYAEAVARNRGLGGEDLRSRAGRRGHRRTPRHPDHDPRRRPGPRRRRPVGHRHPRDGLLARARPRSRAARRPAARPLRAEQGALRRGALLHAGLLRLLPTRRAGHLRPAALAAQRPPEPGQGPRAWRPTPGPLGHGFPVATGCALGAQVTGEDYRTIVVMGDGEMQEGSNWEAAMTAAHYGLHHLTAVVDRNRLQQGARTEDTKTLEPLHDKWTSFGWETRRIDGHDHLALRRGDGALDDRQAGRDRRRHHQGQGRLLHGGPGRVAPQGAHRQSRSAPHSRSCPHDRRSRRRASSHPGPDAPTFDCRVDFADELAQLARADERIVAVCNDSVGSSNLTGFREEFPDRLVNVGIAEQDLVGVGAGLANAGLIPFVCAAAPFLTGRATEQIKADVAYSQRHVVLCGQSPGMAYGELGPTHHSIEDLSWMRAVAGLPVVVPAGPRQTRAAVRWAAALGRGSYLRIPRFKVPEVSAPTTTFEPGRAVQLRSGGRRHHHRDRHDGLPCAVGRRRSRGARASPPACSTWPSSRHSTAGGARRRVARPAASSPSRRPPPAAVSAPRWRRSSAQEHPCPMRILGIKDAFAPTGSATLPARPLRAERRGHRRLQPANWSVAPMAEDLILAIDQGTSSTKSMLVDVERRRSSPRRPSRSARATRSPGWVEQDAEEIWASVQQSVRGCVTDELAERVVGVALSVQRETVVLWDRQTGRAVAPALGWQDQRTADRATELEEAGHAAHVLARTGLPLDPMFSALKAGWLLDQHDPERGRTKQR